MASQPKLSHIGPYQIIEELGRGAMGVVFRGFDPGISRPVAVKVIRPQHFSSEDQGAEARLRFSREAKAAGRLSHPNIITMYQMGEDRGYQYMAMEFVEGVPLNKMIAPGTSMETDKALDILRQVADALDHAHQQDVIHRDIKPPNILVRADGKVKIADFGIARIASQTLTQQGMTLGTPAYMAPEQIQGIKVDGKADQFSLAVLGYQMLTGHRPFEAASEQALILAIVSDAPKPIHEANPEIPEASAEVFARALAKEPGGRYSTCTSFISALAESVKPVPKPEVVPEPVAAAPARQGKSKMVAAAVVLIAVIAGIVAYLALRQPTVHSSNPPATQPGATAPQVAAPAPASTVPLKHASKAASKRTEAQAPANGAAPPDRRQQIKDLQAKRQETAGELEQAQKELEDLKLRYTETHPDVQNAAGRVTTLRKALEEIDDNLDTLKSAR